MLLLSSAKVALTNIGPRAKPKLFSVSLTQNFHRGRQVWKHKGQGLLVPSCFPTLVHPGGSSSWGRFLPEPPGDLF